jgi:septum formation protein
VRYRVIIPDIEESRLLKESGYDYVSRLALEKACFVSELESSFTAVLAADTAVICDDSIFGKPRDYSQFRSMLKALSAREHTVMSAVSMHNGQSSLVLVSKTVVTFRNITSEEIYDYWETGEPRDKAGGYAIQGMGGIFIEHIRGSYSGVVGLPVFETSQLLTKFNIPIWPNSVIT